MSTRPSNFAFLSLEFPGLSEPCLKCEEAIERDPITSCFYARRAMELAVRWQYEHDNRFKLPYDDNLAALLRERSYQNALPDELKPKVDLIRRLGNAAAHSKRRPHQYDAQQAAKELQYFMFWIARLYTNRGRENYPQVTWNQDLVPSGVSAPVVPAKQIRDLEKQLEDRDKELAQARKDGEGYAEEIERLQQQIATIVAQNEALPAETLNYSEADTREYLIDVMLEEAGWNLEDKDKEEEVQGMPNSNGKGYVDYILRGKDGIPLGLVEAKRTSIDPREGKRQAELYANCLQAKYGKRPIIFYSNGYQHYMWDDADYPAREVSGFYGMDELELLFKRRESRAALNQADVDRNITNRPYQLEAIQRVCESYTDKHRKCLVVMATGTGKTRLAIALVDLLQRMNWTKRVLFLADRIALVNQAKRAFNAHLPSSHPASLIEDKDADSRVILSTYPTMMGMLNEFKEDGSRKFNPGHFDLIIVDEAHRSIYLKYKAIFDYFDSLLLGLTATPRSEVDRNTYELFDLDSGNPTHFYELDEAVENGYLVPPKAVSIATKFHREGIKYDDLSDEEKEQWDLLEAEDSDETKFRAIRDAQRQVVDPQKLNQFLFNKDTTDKMLKQLMTEGLMVEGGNKLGKTIIFARNHKHAEFIEDRFNICFPMYKGGFARIIDNQVKYAQSLIDDFSNPSKMPQIAISVDMLDTGIDVPEIVNLVFYKAVCSRTKFHQMIGRGTRLCEDLFAPGQHKEYFKIFDYCSNFEFFKQNPKGIEGSTGKSLAEKNFCYRIGLLKELSSVAEPELADGEAQDVGGEATVPYNELTTFRRKLTRELQTQVEGMDQKNILVRPKWEHVEKYQDGGSWENLTEEDYGDLTQHVAGLPTSADLGITEAQYFDSLMLKMQLDLLQSKPSFEKGRKRIQEIAGKLEEKRTIPQVNAVIQIIVEIQTDEYWQDITLPMLEIIRIKLRDLIKLIDKGDRKIVITNFEDEFVAKTEVNMDGLADASDRAQYKKKIEQYLKNNLNHITLNKLYQNQPLTATDLEELERFLFQASGLGDKELFEQCYGKQEDLASFIRSIIGMDRNTAMNAFSEYLDDSKFNADQIHFINLIIDRLSTTGVIRPESLTKEMPFTSKSERGILEVFPIEEAKKVISIVREFTPLEKQA